MADPSGPARENRAALAELVLAEADAATPFAVLTPRASSARAWRSEFLRRAPQLSGFIRVLTPLGFALAVLREEHQEITLLTNAQRRSLVTELLRSDAANAASLWPTQRPFLLGPAFVDEVLRELSRRVDASTAGPTSGPAALGRGSELDAFIRRYEAELSVRALVDAPRAVRSALDRLLRGGPASEGFDPVGHLIIEQANGYSAGSAALVAVIVDRARRLGTTVTFSTDAPPPADTVIDDDRCSMLRVHHPAVEADAAVSVIRSWLDAGRDPTRLAVVLPQPDPVLLSELASASARSHVPLVVPGTRIGDHRIVDDCVRALSPTDETITHAELVRRACTWWETNAARLIGDNYAVGVLSAFLRALLDGEPIEAALTRPAPPRVASGVTVVSLDDAVARPSDQPWHGVVIVGCVDGRFPRRRVRQPWFRNDPPPPSDASMEDLQSEDELVEHDRLRLAELRAAVATDGSVVAIAAPVGGVLPSPFIDGWRREELSLLLVAAAPPPRPQSETVSDVAVFPSGSLRLSATQLTTFEDCSWRYGFEYGLGLRGAGGAPATAGSLVHEVLEHFLEPGAVERSRERLLTLIDQLWRDDEFPYAAQALDYRRRAEQWLGNWWDFFRQTSPDVRLTEHRFDVPLPVSAHGDSGRADTPAHTLVGSIDRIDVVAPRGDDVERLRIVDYKTGSPKSQAEVDDDLQLAIYHYAAVNDPDVRKLGVPERLELHYLQDDASKERVKVLSRFVSLDLEEATVARIGHLATSILSEHYEPNPDANCDYCAFHTLCSTKLQGRQVR